MNNKHTGLIAKCNQPEMKSDGNGLHFWILISINNSGQFFRQCRVTGDPVF